MLVIEMIRPKFCSRIITIARLLHKNTLLRLVLRMKSQSASLI